MKMLIEQEVRVDKWLWAVRIYKTRNQAAEACKKGRILILDQPVKPSRLLKINDVLNIKKNPVLYSYRVMGLLGKRLSAKAVQEYVENITPEAEMEKLKQRETFFSSEGNAWFERNSEKLGLRKLPESDPLLLEILSLPLPSRSQEGTKILEIGCGDGRRLSWLRQNRGFS